MTDKLPYNVSFMLASYRNAPYVSEAQPPFYVGDMALKDGARRVSTVEDLGKYKLNDDDWFVWDGEKWRNMMDEPTYAVQKYPVNK